MEQIHNEINTLEVRIKKIKKQIELPSTENEIKGQMTEFLQVRLTIMYYYSQATTLIFVCCITTNTQIPQYNEKHNNLL